jgi:DNA-binding LytR/AlgR family response regulator
MIKSVLLIPASEKEYKITINNNPVDIPKCFSINVRQKAIFINYSDVLYIDKLNHDVTIYFSNNEILRFRGTLQDIETKLNDQFCRIHRAFIVNLNYILDIDSKSVTLDNKVKLPYSIDSNELRKMRLKRM